MIRRMAVTMTATLLKNRILVKGKLGRLPYHPRSFFVLSLTYSRARNSALEEQNKKQKLIHDTTTDFTTPQLLPGHLKIASWNVASFRSVYEKGSLKHYIDNEKPDILCLQETKVTEDKFGNQIYDYMSIFYACKENSGYSGTAVLTKLKPLAVLKGIGVEDHDTEGRCITLEFPNFFLVCTYIPNAGQKGENGWPKDLDYRMKWDKAFSEYLKKLDQIKPVIWTGDLNVARLEIDLKNPKTNKKTAGFTDKERQNFETILKENDFVDTYRLLYILAISRRTKS
eukprot:TRINITY_DN1670_c0_g1_i4.p1 TRINITY_DN1670_c0_g1~~TRINITY_DN1670_c0_g1_i4.p1  ORF type:complete len:284 (+),score=46.82 TRINITY_DN1670_c0_g1_i4:325-1176(+)